MNSAGGLSILLIYSFFVLLFFLVCRELVCWYWKINKGLELLQKIHDELKEHTRQRERETVASV